MRSLIGAMCLITATALFLGCIPTTLDPDDPLFPFIDPSTFKPIDDRSSTIRGSVSGNNNYRIFDLGHALRGEMITIQSTQPLFGGTSFIVVALDQDHNLLRRALVPAGGSMSHLMREDAAATYVGVMPAIGSRGGDFELRVSRSGAQIVPPPRTQTVVLNFNGASNVSVNGRSPISFGRFTGKSLGSEYADHTASIRALILEYMRDDYAGYGVDIYDADDPGRPSGVYSTIHFGGDDGRLLGLADNVDEYNENPSQKAIIYIGTFRVFENMHLEPEDMAIMLANVASHELGHLLGLYHTKDPADVMDTTGTAWQLAQDQRFVRAALEATVFPIGYGNSPRILELVVGRRDIPQNALQTPLAEEKMYRRAALRAAVPLDFCTQCGTCQSPDSR